MQEDKVSTVKKRCTSYYKQNIKKFGIEVAKQKTIKIVNCVWVGSGNRKTSLFL